VEIYDILLSWARHCGYVGEEEQIMEVFAALTNNKGLIVECTSGGGKSMMLNLLFELIPDEWYYEVAQIKNAALFRMDWGDPIKFLYITELQKFCSGPDGMENMEVLKALGEGKAATKTITMPDGTTKTFIIPAHIVPIMSIAYDNKNDTRDIEFQRRFAQIHLSIDPIHLREVENMNAERRFFKARFNELTSKEIDQFRAIVMSLIKQDKDEYVVENPFAAYMSAKFPSFGTTTASHLNTYHDFAEGFFKLRLMAMLPDEMDELYTMTTEDGEGTEGYIMTLQDIALNHYIYGDTCTRNILGIPYLGDTVLDLYSDPDVGFTRDPQRSLKKYTEKKVDARRYLTAADIMAALYDKGIKAQYAYIRWLLLHMVSESNHLEVDKDGKNDLRQWSFFRVEAAFPDTKEPEWVEVWQHGRDKVLEYVDEDEAERWIIGQKNNKTGAIEFQNPINKRQYVLVKPHEVFE